jgi:hypothetical protein
LSGKTAIVKCLYWYVGSLVLPVLTCVALGELQLALLCIVGLPGFVGIFPALKLGLDPRPFMVMGCLVQIGLAAGAIYAREQRARNRFYLAFRCLLILNVGIALLFPFLLIMILGGGE